MDVLNFQIQTLTDINVTDFLRAIDENAPKAQSLEGGDGNGPLYECLLDASKKDTLLQACEATTELRIYTPLHTIKLDVSLYRRDYYVTWQFGKDTTTSPECQICH